MSTLALSPAGQPESSEQRRARRLQAFNQPYRKYIHQLTSSSIAAEDLADSFPGLLFALSSQYGTPERRNQAFAIISTGGPLRAAADAVGLPWWMRRLPPQAYTEPLGEVPLDQEFARHIVQFVPTGPLESRVWLWGVLYGYRGCSQEFALWAAGWLTRHHRILTAPQGENTFRYMTAWAWHAGQPETQAHQLLRRKWSGAMGLRRAVDELGNWRRRIALTYAIANVPDTNWIREGSALGYQFVRLNTPMDFIEESNEMDNCLDQFAERLQHHRSHVFSIRRGGRRLANVEIGSHEQEHSMPALLQLRGPRNKRANAELWQAAYAWLGGQTARPRNNRANQTAAIRARDTARQLWAPYLAALEPTGLAPRFRDLVLGPKWTEKRPPPQPQRPSHQSLMSSPSPSSLPPAKASQHVSPSQGTPGRTKLA